MNSLMPMGQCLCPMGSIYVSLSLPMGLCMVPHDHGVTSVRAMPALRVALLIFNEQNTKIRTNERNGLEQWRTGLSIHTLVVK
jgi:hypothetical protein